MGHLPHSHYKMRPEIKITNFDITCNETVSQENKNKLTPHNGTIATKQPRTLGISAMTRDHYLVEV